MCLRLCSCVVVFLLGSAAVLCADSEGYYCAGEGYFAHEMRGFRFFDDQPKTPPKHTLSIYTLGDKGDMAGPYQTDLPEFQVRGMRCDLDAVELLSFDSIYKVPIQPIDKPRRAEKRRLEHPGDTPEGFIALNMLRLDPHAGKLRALWTSPSRIHYVLMVAITSGSRKCTERIDDRIVVSDDDGKVLQGRQIYRGLYPTACFQQ